MNGAESLARTLVAGNVEVCFANPGTSEMHFVAALDKVEEIRCVLVLFENVATGAADGYYRMTGRPAATLLHLGPGLANGLANLHNAKKARSGVVNVVGEHAGYHIAYDAPLTADIEGLAKPMSHWVHTSPDAQSVSADGARAIAVANRSPGEIATLILPADTAWNEAGPISNVAPPAEPEKVRAENIASVAAALRSGKRAMILVGGNAMRERALLLADKIAAKTGARLLGEPQNARLERGAGRVAVDRFPFVTAEAVAATADVEKLVLVGSKAPVAFFAYPDKPSSFVPDGCEVLPLASAGQDVEAALEALALELDAMDAPSPHLVERVAREAVTPTGPIDLAGMGEIIGRAIPENTVFVDDSNTASRPLFTALRDAPKHDWLSLMGGAIGWGITAAVGAAIGAPDRKIVALEGDGSGMYAVSALWTMARENLDIVVVIFANRAYKILHSELAKVGAENPGPRAQSMLRIDQPTLDFVKIAEGQGVPAARVTDLESFREQFEKGLQTTGPYLIEVVL